MITVDALTVYYRQTCAVDDVSFQLDRGEIVGLLGRNGAGKTTLLKTLAGIISPGSGRITPAPHKWRLSFLPETPPLYTDMSVIDFLKWYGQWQGLDTSAASARAEKVMQWCALEARANQRIEHLSHGFQKRVGLAQCLITDPDVLLLDEPLSGLDPAQMAQLRAIIRTFADEGKTVLISSHLLTQLEQLCQRVLVIRTGALVADATIDEMTNHASAVHTISIDVEDATASHEQHLRDLLTSFPGVIHHQMVHRDTLWHLTVESQDDIRGDLARAIVNANLSLLRLERHEHPLEALFLSLTTEDTTQDSADEPS